MQAGLSTIGIGPGSLSTGADAPGAAEAAAAAAPSLTLSTIAISLGTSGDCARKAGPPIAQPTPTRIRLTPMMVMMVPVTTGGKKRSILLTSGAMTSEMMPAPMIAPKIARAPSTP